MKFLTIAAGLTAVALSKEAVTPTNQSTMDQIKSKAKQLYRGFDADNNGQVSLEELTSGVKRGLSWGGDAEESSDPVYATKLYERFVLSDKDKADRKYFIEEDFEQMFRSHHKSKSLIGNIRSRIAQIYDNFDKDHDESISLSELGDAIKSGLGLEADSEHPQKDLQEYGSQLYYRFVKTSKEKFSKKDFEDILGSDDMIEDAKDSVQTAKDKAKEKLKQAKNSAEETIDQAQQKVRQVKDSAESTVQAVKAKIGDVKDSAAETVSNIKDKIGDLSDSAGETVESIKDKLVDIKDSAIETMQEMKAGADKIYEQLDSDNDGQVSFEQAKQGIKAGLGINKEEREDENQRSIYQRLEGLLSGFTQSSEKLTKQHFYNIFAEESDRTKSTFCKACDKIKQKATHIYEAFDADNDGSISLDQIGTAIKQKLGFEEQSQENTSLYEYIKGLYEDYTKGGKKKARLTRQDVEKYIKKWEKQLSPTKSRMQHQEEL